MCFIHFNWHMLIKTNLELHPCHCKVVFLGCIPLLWWINRLSAARGFSPWALMNWWTQRMSLYKLHQKKAEDGKGPRNSPGASGSCSHSSLGGSALRCKALLALNWFSTPSWGWGNWSHFAGLIWGFFHPSFTLFQNHSIHSFGRSAWN